MTIVLYLMPRFFQGYFAASEKELLSKPLFVILHECKSTTLTDSFTNFGGIVSGPVAF